MPEYPVKAFGLQPAEAIKHFEAKGFKITWAWQEQLEINNAAVFTVAKAMKMDVLMDIRGMIDDSLTEGLTFRDFQKELEPKLRVKGWWGKKVVEGPTGKKTVQLGSAYRLKTIYETNIQSAFNAGRWKAFEANKRDRPFLKYVAILDASTRPSHAQLHGIIKPLNSPFWDVNAPPNGFRCRCRLRAFTPEQTKASGGVTTKAPGIRPDEGFESNPGKVQWKPKKADYPADIWQKGGL